MFKIKSFMMIIVFLGITMIAQITLGYGNQSQIKEFIIDFSAETP